MKNQLLNSTEPMQREAVESYQNHELIKSDSLFRILIKEIPQYYNYYNFLGITRARQGQFDNALGLLQQAMNLSKAMREVLHLCIRQFSALKTILN
jgi:tetratricopeptide (TPR) repeat protein